MDIEEAKKLIGSGNISIIDVRTKEEFYSGHIKNAINLDIFSPDFADKIKEFPQEKTFIVYCQSGNRSSSAVNFMKSAGFKNVHDLAGGILKWESKGNEVIK